MLTPILDRFKSPEPKLDPPMARTPAKKKGEVRVRPLLLIRKKLSFAVDQQPITTPKLSNINYQSLNASSFNENKH
jgi:hypothetical protein